MQKGWQLLNSHGQLAEDGNEAAERPRVAAERRKSGAPDGSLIAEQPPDRATLDGQGYIYGMGRTLLIVFVLLSYIAGAQGSDVVVLHHPNFTSYFSTAWHIPIMVMYTLKGDELECEDRMARMTTFTPDPLLPEYTNLQKDYTNSGYDRGHNMSAADNGCDSASMVACFYFSNMTPQPHPFNNGRWKELEMMERDWAKQYGELKVWVGSLDPLYKRIGPDKVCVPRYMYKVIYRPADKTYTYYILPNSASTTKPLESYKVTQSAFTKSSGVHFSKSTAASSFISTAKTPKKSH